MKICSDCKESKSLDDYYSKEKESKTKGKYIYFHPYCKKCASKRAYKWIQNNPEKRRASQKKYDDKPETKEANRIFNQRRRDTGKHKEWLQRTGYSYTKYNEKHYITKEEWEKCKNYFDESCAYCGLSEEVHLDVAKQRLHKEHVDPKGSNYIDNCVPACRKCNSRKHDTKFEEWYTDDNVNYSKDRLIKILNWLSGDWKIIGRTLNQ